MMSVPQQLPITPHNNAQAAMQGFAFYAAGLFIYLILYPVFSLFSITYLVGI